MNETPDVKIFVPKANSRDRRNYIALELLKHSMASESGCSVDVCFRLAQDFIDKEAE